MDGQFLSFSALYEFEQYQAHQARLARTHKPARTPVYRGTVSSSTSKAPALHRPAATRSYAQPSISRKDSNGSQTSQASTSSSVASSQDDALTFTTAPRVHFRPDVERRSSSSTSESYEDADLPSLEANTPMRRSISSASSTASSDSSSSRRSSHADSTIYTSHSAMLHTRSKRYSAPVPDPELTEALRMFHEQLNAEGEATEDEDEDGWIQPGLELRRFQRV